MAVKKPEVALAVFVKTLGLSPIKTRLAETLGRERAAEFYRLSVAAVEATVAAAVDSIGVAAYWAVAEDAGLAELRWQRFPRICQGPGELGERLGRVFGELQQQHDAVIAIGADSPQITPALIGRASEVLLTPRGSGTFFPAPVSDVQCLRGKKVSAPFAHVLGRCHDGGFYLVGTSRGLPAETWRGVPYSTPAAAETLAEKLAAVGPIVELPQLVDVDRVEDLAVLREELRSIAKASAEQLAVLKCIDAAEEVV